MIYEGERNVAGESKTKQEPPVPGGHGRWVRQPTETDPDYEFCPNCLGNRKLIEEGKLTICPRRPAAEKGAS